VVDTTFYPHLPRADRVFNTQATPTRSHMAALWRASCRLLLVRPLMCLLSCSNHSARRPRVNALVATALKGMPLITGTLCWTQATVERFVLPIMSAEEPLWSLRGMASMSKLGKRDELELT